MEAPLGNCKRLHTWGKQQGWRRGERWECTPTMFECVCVCVCVFVCARVRARELSQGNAIDTPSQGRMYAHMYNVLGTAQERRRKGGGTGRRTHRQRETQKTCGCESTNAWDGRDGKGNSQMGADKRLRLGGRADGTAGDRNAGQKREREGGGERESRQDRYARRVPQVTLGTYWDGGNGIA